MAVMGSMQGFGLMPRTCGIFAGDTAPGSCLFSQGCKVLY